jgi:hypothetical protein
MPTRRSLAASLLFACFPAYAGAPNIHIGSLFEFLDPDHQTVLKRVRNSGDATAFVRVEINEVVYDKEGKPTEHPIDKTRIGSNDKDHHALVSSPDRLIVPAGGQSATRLVREGNLDQERYYRIRFIPVIPEKPEEFALNEKEADEYRKSLRAGVKIVTGYGMILIVRPELPRYHTQLSESGSEYAVHNLGDSTIVMSNYRDCRTAADCSEYRTLYVRPGQQERITKQPGHTYSYELREGSEKRDMSFPASQGSE